MSEWISPVKKEEMKQFNTSEIYRTPVFENVMNTWFDTNDTKTRKVLLAVNEADQNTVMVSLANRLYGHITDKVDDIDFGTIPESRGDITRIDNYPKLVDCINIITQILQEYHQDTAPVEIISNAIQNVIDRTEMFTKAYNLNIELPIITYNTIVLGIVSSTSFMISSCIEFIKSSGDEGYDLAVNKTAIIKTRDYVLFKDLERFNRICTNGDFDKAMDFAIKQNTKNLTGLSMYGLGIAVGIGILISIIPIIREMIFFFYYSRVRVSDYFDAQSALLTMNAYNIESNLTKSDKDKKEVANKQKKIADSFKRIANKIAIDSKSGQVKATKEIDKLDKQKVKIDDITDSIPDSANSVLF